MNEETIIVKRLSGLGEPYDEQKLLVSICASCLSVRTPIGSAEMIAQRVCKALKPWLAQKPEITSADIRRKASKHLSVLHPDAAYIYKNHRMML